MLHESDNLICSKQFLALKLYLGQNYMFILSRTIELSKIKSEFSIINEFCNQFLQNDTQISHTPVIWLVELERNVSYSFFSNSFAYDRVPEYDRY